MGDGPPVLVVHGGGGGYDQGLLFARFLGLSDRFQCIAVSRFGYLHSPLLADASPAAQADAYAALLDVLNLPQLTLVGSSAGGPSSLQSAEFGFCVLGVGEFRAASTPFRLWSHQAAPGTSYLRRKDLVDQGFTNDPSD